MLLSKKNIEEYFKFHFSNKSFLEVKEEVSVRSKIYVVNGTYLFKNLKFNSVSEVLTFQNEALVINLLNSLGKLYVAKLHLKDSNFQIMCTEYFSEYTHFSEQAIHNLNEVFLDYTTIVSNKITKEYTPWILGGEVNSTKNVLISTETLGKLKELRHLYKVDHFVHGDLKLDNVLIVDDQIKIIDWEFSGRGDRMWDATYLVASLFIQKMQKDLQMVVDTLSGEMFALFFSVNMTKLSFIKNMFASLFSLNKSSEIKLITFLGLSILQRTIEGFEKESLTDKFLLRLGKEMAFKPDKYQFLIQ